LPLPNLPVPSPRVSRWSRNVPPRRVRQVLAATILLISIPIVTMLQADSGYGIIEPGPVVRLTEAVSGPDVFDPSPTSGWFAFTTVEVSELSYLDLIEDRLSTRAAVKLSPTAFSKEARAQMIESKETASVLAYALARNQEFTSSGAMVLSVLEGSPAALAGVEPGDVITAFAAASVDSPTALRSALAAAPVSSPLTVSRKGEVLKLTVSPVSGRIGVAVTPSYAAALDGLLELDTGSVGGPSAGLLLTLATIDALSPGDLTAGLRIAGTGTIDSEGNVGPISGIKFKAAAAEAAGTQWFFAPVELQDEIPVSLKIKVVPVSTLTDALTQLCDAGATDAICTTTQEVSA
jgi:PDZ domain-containing protein